MGKRQKTEVGVTTVRNVVIYRQIVGRIKYRKKGVIAPVGEIKLQYSTPVSYTHLDVYKRQI